MAKSWSQPNEDRGETSPQSSGEPLTKIPNSDPADSSSSSNGDALQLPDDWEPINHEQHETDAKQPEDLLEVTPQQRGSYNLRLKTMLAAAALSILPMLTLGAITYHFATQTISQQEAQARRSGASNLAELSYLGFLLQRQLQFALSIGTGVIALFAVAIAAILANRSVTPVLSAAAISATAAKQLRRSRGESEPSADNRANLLKAMKTDLNLVAQEAAELPRRRQAEEEQQRLAAQAKREELRLLSQVTDRIREASSVKELWTTMVVEVRKALKADRVIFFQLSSNGDGVVAAESVAAGFPKIQGSNIIDPCFKERHIELYRQGRVRAIDNIRQAGITECHIELLEQYAVKANLVAPILRDGQLLGLLIAHQCGNPRVWQPAEIQFMTQLALQTGFVVERVSLMAERKVELETKQLLDEITRRIRSVRTSEEALEATVTEIRQVLKSDRVIFFQLDSNGNGTVAAESVAAGFPAIRGAKIVDPCFKERHINLYLQGRVRATENIHQSGLTECHIELLEQYAVKANLVAPVVCEEKLIGLLIAHQCSRPRAWKPAEINFFSSLSTQVGFAVAQVSLAAERRAEEEAERLLDKMVRRIREARNLEETLALTVQEARKLIKAERVVFFRIEPDGSGIVVAESVVEGFLKIQGSRIFDPCFKERHIELYQKGRVKAIDNVHREKLARCFVEMLEQYEVQASLVAPVVCDSELLGVLIAHQCSRPRTWKPTEINFFSRLTTQVSYALDRRQFPAEEEAEQEAEQLLASITKQIRGMSSAEAVLQFVVEEARQAIETDRVLFFRLKPDGSSGCATAESVASEFPKTLGIEIADPCFKDRHINLYRQGRVRAIDNIYNANLSDCHLELLKQFSVQSDLITPVVQGGNLLGLLIAHHCAKSRAWQPIEINFFSRLATQVGYALDQIDLLKQVEAARQQLEGTLQPRDRAIAAASLGITMSDARQPDYPLVYCNPAFERITGYSKEESLGRNCRFLQGTDTDTNAVNEIRLALREQRECQVLLKNYRKDGTPFWNELKIAPVRDEQGQITHFIGLQVDVSNLQQSVQQLRSATQTVSQATQNNQTAAAALSADVSLQATQIAAALENTQSLISLMQTLGADAEKAKSQIEQVHQLVQSGNSSLTHSQAEVLRIQRLLEAAQSIQHLDQLSQRMTAVVAPMNDFAAQASVSAMNLAVEVGRAENGDDRDLMSIAESVRFLAQQSETATVEIQQVVDELQSTIDETLTVIQTGSESLTNWTEWAAQARQNFDALLTLTTENHQLVEEIAQTTQENMQAATNQNQTMRELAAIADHASETSEVIIQSVTELQAAAQIIQTSTESL